MYPEICTKWCANFGTPECPNSAKCMGMANKPYVVAALKWAAEMAAKAAKEDV